MLASGALYRPLLKGLYQAVPIPVVGPTTKGVVAKLGPERSINWYPVKPERENEPWVLRGRPGLIEFCDLVKKPPRGVHNHNGRYFVVSGAKVFEVREDGTSYEWGAIASTRKKVTMASLLNVIVIGDGTKYYSLDLDTDDGPQEITDAPRGRFCRFFNQRILYQGENGQVFYSELNDPTNIPGLNFFTAESLPDEIEAIETTEDQVWLIGADSAEPWYDSGDSDNPFQRVQGGVSYIGTEWPDTVLRLDNSIWMVGRDKEGAGIVWRSSGGQFVRVSTSAIERMIAGAEKLSALSYQEEGHTFFGLNSPDWSVYFDIKTGEWHERAWQNRNTGIQERHRPETHAYCYGLHLVTDYKTGQVYRQGLDLYDDDGQEIVRTRVTPKLSFNHQQVIVSELWLDFATGVGIDGEGQGDAPEVMLRMSGDGVSYGPILTAPLGAIGEYDTSVRFFDLGIVRDMVFEISVSDPIVTGLMGGEARIKAGRR